MSVISKLQVPKPARKLPPGYRFLPKQNEVIYYLHIWISGDGFPIEVDIRDCDLYGEEDPWEMWSSWSAVGEDVEAVYVITMLKTKGRGSRIDRTTGKSGGCWHGESRGKDFTVEIGSRSLICWEKTYTYKNKNLICNDDQNAQLGWDMTEFSCPALSPNYVICRIRRKETKYNSKSKQESKSITHCKVEEEQEMDVVPRGCRFCPTKEELVGYYLFYRIAKKESPFGGMVVRECDLYGEEEPWKVWDQFASNDSTEQDLYFFTELKKQRPGTETSRNLRKVGLGTWHEEGVDWEAEVKIKNGENIRVLRGIRRRYKYKNLNSSHNGRWIMYEYSSPSLSSELALCVLRNNGGRSSDGDGDLKVTRLWKNEVVFHEVDEDDKVDETTSNDSEKIEEQVFCSDDSETIVTDSDETEDDEPRPKSKLGRFRYELLPENWLSLGSGSVYTGETQEGARHKLRTWMQRRKRGSNSRFVKFRR